MIGFEHYVSGGEVGRKLAQDPEELGYALKELLDNGSDKMGAEVAEYLDPSDADAVVDFLRLLADQIEAATA